MQEIKDLANKFQVLKSLAAEKKAELKEITDQWSEVENEILEFMGDEGIPQFTLEGDVNYSFSLSTKSFLSVAKSHMDEFIAYVKAIGNEGIVKESIDANTLKSFLNEHQEKLIQDLLHTGEIDDIVEARNKVAKILSEKGVSVFDKKGLSVRKVSKKK